jgi:hypothetical protein
MQTLRALFEKPRIIRVEHVNAPVALAGGRTTIRVVAEGAGLLEVGIGPSAVRRFVRGRIEEDFLVAVHKDLLVRFVSLAGRASRHLTLEHVLRPAPGRLVLDEQTRPGELRPPADVAVPLPGLRSPRVDAARVAVPSARTAAPAPRAGPRLSLPSIRPRPLGPRLRVHQGDAS